MLAPSNLAPAKVLHDSKRLISLPPPLAFLLNLGGLIIVMIVAFGHDRSSPRTLSSQLFPVEKFFFVNPVITAFQCVASIVRCAFFCDLDSCFVTDILAKNPENAYSGPIFIWPQLFTLSFARTQH